MRRTWIGGAPPDFRIPLREYPIRSLARAPGPSGNSFAWRSGSVRAREAPFHASAQRGELPFIAFRLTEPATDRIANEAGRLVDLELPHNLGAVRLSGLHTQSENRRDLFRGLSLGHQLETLTF